MGASGKLKVARARATPPLRCARPRTMFGWVAKPQHSTRSLDPVQAGSQCATLSRPGCSLASQPQHRRPAARRRRALRHPLIARSARGGPTKLVCKHQGTRWGPNEWRINWCAQRTRWVATPPKAVGRANRQICGSTTPLWLSHPISNPRSGGPAEQTSNLLVCHLSACNHQTSRSHSGFAATRDPLPSLRRLFTREARVVGLRATVGSEQPGRLNVCG